MVYGNIKGIKQNIIDRLDKLNEFKSDEFLSLELMQEICDITRILSREVCIYISRAGEVIYVSLGEDDRASLASLSFRRSGSRLSAIRCIHTHPGGNGMLSAVDIESLKKLRFDAMCAVGVLESGATNATCALLDDSDQGYKMLYAHKAQNIPQQQWMDEIFVADKIIKHDEFALQENEPERVLLMGNDEESLEELERLTDTAGGITVYKAIQKNAKGMFGKGKLEELSLIVQAKNIDIAIFDDELTIVQQRAVEEQLGVPVIDRTALILDIFAMRARTKEGKMQVELAQAQYRLSRLKGEGISLSRQGGGIGTRGPGEEKLETDRRHINRRIYELKEQLAQLSARRGLVRKQRQKQQLPQIALVGYTNAGKSTLLKALSGSEVFCEDKLFATLDPLTRRAEIDKNFSVCLTDTVGFIKKLPHQLVEAFRSTLEEAVFADILLHVCDGSTPQMFEQMQAVEQVLLSIGAANIPTIVVINKVDACENLPQVKDAVYISAKEESGLEELKKAIIEKLKSLQATCTLTVPYARGDVTAYIYSHCKILSEEYNDEGTVITFTAPSSEVNKIKAKLK